MSDEVLTLYQPLDVMDRLIVIDSILYPALCNGKKFGISIVCGATGKITHFPMDGAMTGACDTVMGQGIATKKGKTLFVTEVESTREIGEEWMTKPDGTHREITYLGRPADLTGYTGGLRLEYEREGETIFDDHGEPISVRVVKIALINCSGETGDEDEEFARLACETLRQYWESGQVLEKITIDISLPSPA